MRSANREAVTLLVDEQKVFGMIHRPTQPATAQLPALLILHGFTGSKDHPHQIFVKLAEAVARAGMIALRIDLRGRGDSEGDMAVDVTPLTDLLDVRTALDYLAAQPDVDPTKLGVMGLSWGGTLAAVVAGQDPRIAFTVLWNTGDGAHTWQPKDFVEIGGRPVLEFWGTLIGQQFYAEMGAVNVPTYLPQARGPVLIVQSTADEAIYEPQQTAQRLANLLAAAQVPYALCWIEGADHAFMRYACEQEAITKTVAWLQSTLFGGERND